MPILEQYQEVFSEELGTFTGPKIKLITDPQVAPKFISLGRYHTLCVIKLNSNLNPCIIEPIQASDWAAPIVPVLKQDKKTIRLCGDYRFTVN